MRKVHRNGPIMVAIPKEVRNFPIVSPLLPEGARSRIIARAVGAKAAITRAWKILIG